MLRRRRPSWTPAPAELDPVGGHERAGRSDAAVATIGAGRAGPGADRAEFCGWSRTRAGRMPRWSLAVPG